MPKPSWPTEQVCLEEIQRRLSTVTIAKIASTLGISEPYQRKSARGDIARMRRHWQAPAELVGTSND